MTVTPHTRPSDELIRGTLAGSVLDAVGDTPLVRLDRIDPDLGRELYVKLELLNPGGSHKVRIGLSMVEAAERDGILQRGSGQTIVEATGGNTGIGLAMVAALYGYRLVLIIPDNYSQSKQELLRAYGAEIILADHTEGNNAHTELATRLLLENPDWVMLYQQANPANPGIHERRTAQEVLAALDGQAPDAMVAGVGTGGHLTGVGRVLKAANPELKIGAMVPDECSLRENRFVEHRIQGVAVGVVPPILDIDLIDDELAVSYPEARDMMRRLLSTEALAVGISSAAVMSAAVRYARQLPEGSRVLTFAYDGIHDYLEVLSDGSAG